ncbi:hypothetical protein SPACI_044680 [Sporomusa acidovorans DSM 3132]|uniref:Uncharacterized protein n=1 Tax=Sporomusa acidovorans (strain ATCC 49682 / DSM 3132 / Mol) TaxID=1123286 RepID=A0ABZ3J8B9_SPOA4|nr:hypothetical protein SPACI_04730 [Sporomusa acidovorans DSM 3132]
MSFIFRWLIFILILIILSPIWLLCLPLSLLTLVTLLTDPTLYLGQVRGQTLWEAFKIYKIIFEAIYNIVFSKKGENQ